MDRRYYGLKALIGGAALSLAILGGGMECSRLAVGHNPNYEAASIAQSALHNAGLNIGHSLRLFFSRARASL